MKNVQPNNFRSMFINSIIIRQKHKKNPKLNIFSSSLFSVFESNKEKRKSLNLNPVVFCSDTGRHRQPPQPPARPGSQGVGGSHGALWPGRAPSWQWDLLRHLGAAQCELSCPRCRGNGGGGPPAPVRGVPGERPPSPRRSALQTAPSVAPWRWWGMSFRPPSGAPAPKEKRLPWSVLTSLWNE